MLHLWPSCRVGTAKPRSSFPRRSNELAAEADAVVYARVAAVSVRQAAGTLRVERIVWLEVVRYLKGSGEPRCDCASRRNLGRYRTVKLAPRVGGWGRGRLLPPWGGEVPGRGWSGSGRACTASVATGRAGPPRRARVLSIWRRWIRSRGTWPQAGDVARRVRRTAGSDAHRAACAAGRRPMTRRVLVSRILAIALVTGLGPAGFRVLKFGMQLQGRTVVLRWSRTPIRYAVCDRTVTGVSASQFDDALRRAFAAWQAVPTAIVDVRAPRVHQRQAVRR